MTVPSVVRFDSPSAAPVVDFPREDRREVGCPRRETWTLYDSAPAGLIAGIWACEVGRWRIAFAANKHEYFFVLSGKVRLHDQSGAFTDIGAGEGGVIPAGFQGAFEVLEPVRKHFVVVESGMSSAD